MREKTTNITTILALKRAKKIKNYKIILTSTFYI